MLGRRGDTGTFFETLNSSYSSCPSRLLQTALPNLTELPGGSGGKGPLLSPSPRDWKKWGWSGRRFRRRFNKLFLWKGLTLTPGGLAARRFSAATTRLRCCARSSLAQPRSDRRGCVPARVSGHNRQQAEAGPQAAVCQCHCPVQPRTERITSGPGSH